MTFDLTFVVACAAAAIAIGCVLALLAQKKRCHENKEALDVEVYQVRNVCETRAAELTTELKKAMEALEAGLRAPEHALVDGRLRRTNRAEALRLLRSGIPPEKAASTLGVPKHDVLLLSKVSKVLFAQ